MADDNYITLELPEDQFPTPPAARPAPQGASPLPLNPATIPGMTGNFPWPVAQIIKPEFMTKQEQDTLASLGWKPGDPIPADMAQRLSGEVNQVRSDARNVSPPVPVNTPPMDVPPEVPISTLPPARQTELRQALADAKRIDAQPQAEPGVNPAYSSQLQVGQSLELVNDLKPNAAAASPQSAQEQTGTAGAATLSNCPHCNWDLSVLDIPEPDETTRLWYMQAVMGMIPFEKPIPIFDGAAEITFRELRFEELEAIYQQVREDIRKRETAEGISARETDFMEAINRYRVAMQMVKIMLSGKGTIIPNRKDDGSPVNMPAVLAAVTRLLNNSSLYRVVRLELIKFNRLVARLEALSTTENFWKAASKT